MPVLAVLVGWDEVTARDLWHGLAAVVLLASTPSSTSDPSGARTSRVVAASVLAGGGFA